MTWLTRLGLDHSRFTILSMIILVLVGLTSYLGFPKREDPEIIVRTAIVTAANPGLTLEQLEELVALPLEETARGIAGVDEVRTQLTGGAAILQVDLEDAVPETDLDRVFDDIRNDMQGIASSLPEGTLGPVVNSDFGDVAIATIAITGEGIALPEVEDIAKDLRDRLYALEPVAAVQLFGKQDEVVTLEIDRARLASVGGTINPILAALRGQNVRLPAGSIIADGVRVPLEATGDVASVDEIAAILIDLPGGGLMRLGDLVEVSRALEDPPDRPVYSNGRPAIVLSVEMSEGVDITALGPDLRALVDAFQAEQPLGVLVAFSTFQPQVVEDSVNGALVNMAQTFVVVLLVMLLFLGWREALVVAAIVPFAVSFAFAWMGTFGVELQQVSIAAIIISLGLLVDNGVVVIEDMQRRMRDGTTRRDAAMGAGAQYAVPLAIASTTTVAAFLPLFLLEGTEGQYGYSLGVVVMLMLLGSFLSALYLLPRLAVWIVPEAKGEEKRGLFDRIATGYGRLVRQVVRAPLIAVALVVGVLVAGISQFPGVPQQLFPYSERAQLLAYIDLTKGSDVTATQDTALDFSAWLTGPENPEVLDVTTYVGSGGPRFVLSLDPADTDPAAAFMVINTSDYTASEDVLRRARVHVAQALPDAMVRVKRIAMGGREPGVDIEVSGPDADRLIWAAGQMRAAFADVPHLIQNRDDWGGRHLVSTIVVAQDRVRAYDLTSAEISDALEGFFDGARVSTLRDGDDLVPIVLRGAPGDRADFDALTNAAVDAGGQVLALDQIATLTPRLEPSTIRRVDQVRTVTVTAIPQTMTAAELLSEVQPTIDRLAKELGPAYSLSVGGELENSTEVRTKLGGGLPIAAMVMMLALMAQFNSFRRVAITLLSTPLVVAGVAPTLLATGQPLSFFGILGMIALAGIIINNAIVLIDQIDIERADKTVPEAVEAAAVKRFRPIVMTSLTTVLGLAPMAIVGGALWEPMATLMMGGLAGAALLALIWVPALYQLFFRRADRRAQGRVEPDGSDAPAPGGRTQAGAA
ncbi:MAG: efflux RND transporter permease subunit [Pseudomonadota bacterium]